MFYACPLFIALKSVLLKPSAFFRADLTHYSGIGHNIADVAAEAASFSINTETIAVAIKELDKCLKVTENGGALTAALSAGAAAGVTGAISPVPSNIFQRVPPGDNSIGDPDELKLSCAIAKGVMLKLEACLDAISLAPSVQPQPCPTCGAAVTHHSLVCASCSTLRKRCIGHNISPVSKASDVIPQRPHPSSLSLWCRCIARQVEGRRLQLQRSLPLSSHTRQMFTIHFSQFHMMVC
jgi:hypothetical protein